MSRHRQPDISIAGSVYIRLDTMLTVSARHDDVEEERDDAVHGRQPVHRRDAGGDFFGNVMMPLRSRLFSSSITESGICAGASRDMTMLTTPGE
jgi:hypothetical protein